jgi:hypothetical protein
MPCSLPARCAIPGDGQEDLPQHAMESRPTSTVRLLLPREHGAWGQLGVPLVTALASATPTVAAGAFAVAAGALFLSHEPLLVLLGHRGVRALREDGARARRRFLGLVLLGASSGIVGLAMAPRARAASSIPLLLALVVAAFIAHRSERSAAGEVVAAAALSSSGVPVMVASGIKLHEALWTWSVWGVGFALVTPAVRTVIAHARAPRTLSRRLLRLLPASVGFVALSVSAPAWSTWATLPFVFAAVALVLAPPAPRHLPRVGWALVVASLTAATVLLVAFRFFRGA